MLTPPSAVTKNDGSYRMWLTTEEEGKWRRGGTRTNVVSGADGGAERPKVGGD